MIGHKRYLETWKIVKPLLKAKSQNIGRIDHSVIIVSILKRGEFAFRMHYFSTESIDLIISEILEKYNYNDIEEIYAA